jgi:CBS domain-containing protein
MRIGEICTREVVYCSRDTGVLEVARLMRKHHVGDLIVAETRDGRLEPVGIVTDRDLVVKVLAEGVAAETLTAGDLMNRMLVTAAEAESVGADGALVGVLSADDVTEFLAEELSGLARLAPRQSLREKTAVLPVTE